MIKKQATLGAGCFWCIEAIFIQLKGVNEVVPGFAGGNIRNPPYREVCQGRTGHAEVIRIDYDSEIISFEMLLEVFWFVHDPTTLSRQGKDIGTQYRSVIFYHDENQRILAEKYKRKLNESAAYDNPVVTEITQLTTYFNAESEHKDFYLRNPELAYCLKVIKPKVEIFRNTFPNQLKSS